MGEYGVKLLDLTGFEYESYFMCDTMHIGWKGWLAVDQALISYYYGKGEQEKYRTLFRYALSATIGLAVAAFISAWLGAGLLVGIFVSPELSELRLYSSHVFRIFSISFLVMGFNVVSGGFFTAIERPKSSLAISLGRGFVMLVVALKLCIGVAGGEGIWWASTVSELLCLLVTAGLMYRYARTEKSGVIREKTQVKNSGAGYLTTSEK